MSLHHGVRRHVVSSDFGRGVLTIEKLLYRVLNLRRLLCWKNLAAQVEHWEWARNAHGLADCNNSEVPSR